MTDQVQPLVHVIAQMVRAKPGHRLIFTYDQLMDPDALGELCPDPKFIMTARYLSRRLIFGPDGKSNLVPRRGFTAYGLLYEVSEVALACLDLRLGVPSERDRFGCFARTSDDRLAVTEFYAARNHRQGHADPDELLKIMDLAKGFGFPNEYLTELASWCSSPASDERGVQ